MHAHNTREAQAGGELNGPSPSNATAQPVHTHMWRPPQRPPNTHPHLLTPNAAATFSLVTPMGIRQPCALGNSPTRSLMPPSQAMGLEDMVSTPVCVWGGGHVVWWGRHRGEGRDAVHGLVRSVRQHRQHSSFLQVSITVSDQPRLLFFWLLPCPASSCTQQTKSNPNAPAASPTV